MTALLPLSLSASAKLQRWARLAAITPQHRDEHWLLHLTDQTGTATSLPQTTTLHLVWSGLIWQLVSLTNASDHYNQHFATEELCFDAERQHYWRLQAGPEPTASPALLEQTLTKLYQRQQQGHVLIQSDPLPSASSLGLNLAPAMVAPSVR